jgi:membrane protein required for colicin V production
MTDNPPRWLTNAALAPVSAKAAHAIQIVLPTLGKGADALTPVVGSSVREGFSDR